MKKILAIILLLILMSYPAQAKYIPKFKGEMESEFSIYEKVDFVEFKNFEEIEVLNLIIPENSLIKAQIYHAQGEKRWHKSGYFICKLLSYEEEGKKEVNIEENDLYFIARKYDKPNVALGVATGVELSASTVAAVFLPGVDMAYFFMKGLISGRNHPNRLKAGIMEAYENSIFWFWIKGRPIELEEEDFAQFKRINQTKAITIKNKADKKEAKRVLKEEKKLAKAEKKNLKKAEKRAAKEAKKEAERQSKKENVSEEI